MEHGGNKYRKINSVLIIVMKQNKFVVFCVNFVIQGLGYFGMMLSVCVWLLIICQHEISDWINNGGTKLDDRGVE
jgi:hypothetical protein